VRIQLTIPEQVFNLASGGATIDAALIKPYLPDPWSEFSYLIKSIVEQVSQFNKFLAPKPIGAQWSSDNTLFAFWIGINDVVCSVHLIQIVMLMESSE